MKISKDYYAEVMTPRRKLQIVGDRLEDVLDMLSDIKGDLFEEEIGS